MTIAYFTVARNAMADALLALLDGTLPGKLIFYDIADEVVATLFFSSVAFDPAVNGIAIANPITPETDAPGGEISYAVLHNGDTEQGIIGCSVTGPGGGGDIELTSITVVAGQVVGMDSGMSYTAPA